jgi:hypothetical protein
MFQLDYGSNIHEQFLACTVDPMHLFEGGWLSMVCKAFVDSLGATAAACIDQWALSRIRIPALVSPKDFLGWIIPVV